MKQKIQNIFKKAERAILSCENSKALYDIKVQYLGKKGEVSRLMKELKAIPIEQRPEFGQLFNQVRGDLEALHEKRKKALESKDLESKIETEFLDLSLPGPSLPMGAKHPVNQTILDIVEIFRPLGYTVELGPFVESDWYNFEALNVPPFHPSRELQDTFYLEGSSVLRTHTSPIQIRVMECQKPPLAVLAPGAVFRRDSDTSHSPMFHQVEGLLVDQKVSFSDLKGTLSYFLKEFFGSNVKLRFRPAFFPFTEPSAEYDISCPFCKDGCSICKQSRWIEIGGCGLVHPKVFQSVKLDSRRNQGFAFGLGIERIAIIRYGISNIHLFFENDIRFLKQFIGVRA